MRLLQTIVLSETVRGILAKMVAGYIKFVYKTTPWHFLNKEVLDTLIAQKKTIVFAFWHGRLVMMPNSQKWDLPVYMLLSRHREGLMIAQVLKCFGIKSIHGSTNRGGIKAGIEILEKIKSGAAVGFSPDGPRGPTQKCSQGIIALASLAARDLREVHIVPMSFSISNYKQMRSWDRLMFPFPFSRKGCFAIAEPIVIDKPLGEDNLTTIQELLEKRLNQAQDNADAFVKSS